jgi:uncharacterized protein (TIGR03083 family)
MTRTGMDVHGGVVDLLGAWVVDACDDGESAAVEAHLRDCAACAAEAQHLQAAASWLGVEQLQPPPARLRDSVLTMARARRQPSLLHTLTSAYAGQVALLDRALDSLTPSDWQHADPRHHDVTGIIRHLVSNDTMLAADLGMPIVSVPVAIASGPAVHEAWRAQTDTIVEGLNAGIELDRPARLAGTSETVQGLLRDVLVQRAFETWTHLDDLGAAVGQPQPAPRPEQVRRIVDLAVKLLPDALRTHGVARPGRSARLALDGSGGGAWTFPLGRHPVHADDHASIAVTISAKAVEFCRLVANRRTPETLRHTVTGDQGLATAVLRVASTLGCD